MLLVCNCVRICSLSEVLGGRGSRREISNLEPPILSECWLVMHNVEIIRFSELASGEECPNMSPMILWGGAEDCLCFVSSWKR